MDNFFSQFFNNLLATNLTINVIGDVLIDEYYQVEVDRISPEFPIPVHHSKNENPTNVLCGGAANVAAQFKNFGVNVNLISLMNSRTQKICESNGISTKNSIIDDKINNPIKKRFYKDFHPLIRWDIEQPAFGLQNIDEHLNKIDLPDADINIFSDYDKGLFSTNWHKKFLTKSKSLVDPKKNFKIWENCYLFKPNAVEAKRFVLKDNAEDQLKWIQALLNCENVVITNSGYGVSAIDDDQKIYKVLPHRVLTKPESVIGAGDCFMAFLAMSVGLNMDLLDCLSIAFEAGTNYVANRYNKPLNPSDFFIKDKVITNPAVLKNRDFDLVWSNGCYDIMHFGHVNSLKYAKSLGTKLCVGVNSDESIKRLKGDNRPIVPLKERVEMLKALDCVDFVVVLEDDFPQNIIEQIKPDVLVKGADWEGKNVAGADVVKKVEYFPLVEGLSTTNIIEKIIRVYG